MGLSRQDIEKGLTLLGERALRDSLVLEIAIYGGAALMLAFDARQATKDIDAIARGDTGLVRQYRDEIAAEQGWPQDWLNDAVKGFVSLKDNEQTSIGASYPIGETPGLRVYFPSAEYLLAMKCIAMRIDAADGTQDLADIKLLMSRTGLTTAEDLLDLVSSFYPNRLIQPRTAFGIEQIAEEYAQEQQDEKTDNDPSRDRQR